MSINKVTLRRRIIAACAGGIFSLALIGGLAAGDAVMKEEQSKYEQLGVDDIDNDAPIFIDYQDGSSEIVNPNKTPILGDKESEWDISTEPVDDIEETEVLGADDIEKEAHWELVEPVDDLDD